MPQPDRFISIAYQQIDFLIPNDCVASSVGVKDLDIKQIQGTESGIYDFDEVASVFMQSPHESEIKTMIVLKSEDDENPLNHISIITTQECKVCTIPLSELSLFSDFYAEQFKKFGVLACGFKDDKLRILLDVYKTIHYMTDNELEEL